MAKKILFVCKYNRFRSKFSEAYFNAKNKNKRWRAVSAGLIRVRRLLGPTMLSRSAFIEDKYGIRIGRRSKGLTYKLLKNVDKIVVVADDVPKIVFNCPEWSGKVECWKIPDVWGDNNKKVGESLKILTKKLDVLIGRLENEKR